MEPALGLGIESAAWISDGRAKLQRILSPVDALNQLRASVSGSFPISAESNSGPCPASALIGGVAGN